MSNWNKRHAVARWDQIREQVGPEGKRTVVHYESGKPKRFRREWTDKIAWKEAKP